MSACSERQLSQVKDYDDLDHPTKSLTDYDYESQELVNLAKTNSHKSVAENMESKLTQTQNNFKVT